jgi:hypothetical protein
LIPEIGMVVFSLVLFGLGFRAGYAARVYREFKEKHKE